MEMIIREAITLGFSFQGLLVIYHMFSLGGFELAATIEHTGGAETPAFYLKYAVKGFKMSS